MTVRSRRGVAIGALIALWAPIGALALAALVKNKIAPYDSIHERVNEIGVLLWASLTVFGPIGIVTAGWSAGVRGVLAWLALVVVVGPLFVALWFTAAVAISGTLGNPA